MPDTPFGSYVIMLAAHEHGVQRGSRVGMERPLWSWNSSVEPSRDNVSIKNGDFFWAIACLIEGEYPPNYGPRLREEVELGIDSGEQNPGRPVRRERSTLCTGSS